MNEKDPEFWDKLKKDFDWSAFGGICLSCKSYRVNAKCQEFFEQNKLPLGTCMFCLEKSYRYGNRRVVNPIDVAFGW